MENEASEKNEMEVGVRGGVYNVSNVDGVPKISPKSQSATSVKPSQKVIMILMMMMMMITVVK